MSDAYLMSEFAITREEAEAIVGGAPFSVCVLEYCPRCGHLPRRFIWTNGQKHGGGQRSTYKFVCLHCLSHGNTGSSTEMARRAWNNGVHEDNLGRWAALEIGGEYYLSE